MSITLGFQSYQRRCVRYVFGVQSYLLDGCVMPGVARRISSLHRWPRGDTGSTMEGKFVAVSMWFRRGKPSKPSKQLVNQRKKSITESKGLRGKKGEAKIPKIKHSPSGLCFMDHHGHTLEDSENKSWRTSVEGDEIRCLPGLAYRNSMTPYSCSCFFFLLLPFLLKGCCQTSSKVKYQMPTMVCFPVSFHLQKWRCFRGFSYLKFTFQGGFFLGGWSFSKPRHVTSHHFWNQERWGCFSISKLVVYWRVFGSFRWKNCVLKFPTLVFISFPHLWDSPGHGFFFKKPSFALENSCLSLSFHVLRDSSPTKSFWVFWVPEKLQGFASRMLWNSCTASEYLKLIKTWQIFASTSLKNPNSPFAKVKPFVPGPKSCLEEENPTHIKWILFCKDKVDRRHPASLAASCWHVFSLCRFFVLQSWL